jgi:uncharacterized membrane protein YdcZ (DUF606 family)
MDRVAALICTLAVGGLVALQPPANAELSRYVGDLGAALISLTISTVIVSVIADHLGVLRLDEVGISWQRMLGVALVIGGTCLITTR